MPALDGATIRPSSEACPCEACRSGKPIDLHARIRSLMGCFRGEDQTILAGQMAQGRVLGDDLPLLAQVTGLELAAIAARKDIPFRISPLKKAENALANIDRIAADDDSNKKLRGAIGRMLRGEFRESDETLELKLRARGAVYDVVVPTAYFSFSLIFEIFITECYGFESKPVDVIYDLGANIGLSALYIHTVYPGAKLVCVEPMPKNVEFLVENLRRNRIDAQVLPIAVGDTTGEIEIFTTQEVGAQSSIVDDGEAGQRAIKIQSRRFDEVITGTGYGMKIDIEGAEHLLAAFPDVLAKAAWVQGELHYAPATDRTASGRLDAMLQENFALELTPFKCTPEDLKTCRMFKGARR